MNTLNFSKEMKEIFDKIDVSEYNYQKADNRYKSVSFYIEDSFLSEFNPEIYLQGSFKLGTAIRPLTSEGSYDIDIVCKLNGFSIMDISQFDLKNKTGDVVKEYAISNSMKNDAVNGKRCWTLNYVDESNFHIDILPAIPDSFNVDDSICITDKRNPSYNKISSDWEISNPKGYYRWFREQSNYYEYKKRMAESFQSSIEDVPYYKVKTPLQRVVQIFKRHAEVMFENKMEYKPTSIIITTLAAYAYPKAIIISGDFTTLIMKIIENLMVGVEYDTDSPCVYNPANRKEKLSGKWDENNRYFKEFLTWINQLKVDFSFDQEISNIERMSYIEQSLKINSGNKMSAALSSLSHHQIPEWILGPMVDVKIKGSMSTTKDGSYIEIKSGTPLGKNVSLKFEVIANKVDEYDIHWQITNTGFEARRSNCLRGDFYESELFEGKKVRKEVTSYIGKHFVEAYIVKNNICYGKSDPFTVNIVKGLKGYR